MTTERGKLYQDRLYGTKVLSPLAVEVMNSAEFQRLAGLKQLGFTDLVFRSATHTRLEHSVGTYFMCRTMMRRIVQNHDRLGLGHPGRHVSDRFALTPPDWLPEETAEAIQKKRLPSSFQSRWRGLTEVISIAGLIHDVGHVPFGHTLEDEFTGIYGRHDRLAGPRLHEMLYRKDSELAQVFSSELPPWLPGITNEELRSLVYLILNWKEKIKPVKSFSTLLAEAISKATEKPQKKRLEQLLEIYTSLSSSQMFHPFMSDIVGNTICADLLDYLPRDRMNLGMESRRHSRLLRYHTIRTGTLYEPEEGLRLSILVTRKGRGGQRRDVATTVLDIMRERYQMPERVFYHHKKAAASAMLAKLTELAGLVDAKPRGEDGIYPAPWSEQPLERDQVPHMVHLSDAELLSYLGQVKVPEEFRQLQRRLFQSLRYRRKGLYRTLLVIDSDLAHSSPGEIGSFARCFRDNNGKDRIALEADLAKAAGVDGGDVLIYCPDPEMQAKEVDARVEIQEGRVLPLRIQHESFAYSDDLKVLEQYYRELWCAYVFVSPTVYRDEQKCRAVVDRVCEKLHMQKEVAYKKVRGFSFSAVSDQASRQAFAIAASIVRSLPFEDVPFEVIGELIQHAGPNAVSAGHVEKARLAAVFESIVLRMEARKHGPRDPSRLAWEHRSAELLAGDANSVLAKGGHSGFSAYQAALVSSIAVGDSAAGGPAVEISPATAVDGPERVFTRDDIRRKLVAIGERIGQPKVAEEWNTKLDSVVDSYSVLPADELRRRLDMIEKASIEQSKALAARLSVDQLLKLVEYTPPQKNDEGTLFEE